MCLLCVSAVADSGDIRINMKVAFIFQLLNSMLTFDSLFLNDICTEDFMAGHSCLHIMLCLSPLHYNKMLPYDQQLKVRCLFYFCSGGQKSMVKMADVWKELGLYFWDCHLLLYSPGTNVVFAQSGRVYLLSPAFLCIAAPSTELNSTASYKCASLSCYIGKQVSTWNLKGTLLNDSKFLQKKKQTKQNNNKKKSLKHQIFLRGFCFNPESRLDFHISEGTG